MSIGQIAVLILALLAAGVVGSILTYTGCCVHCDRSHHVEHCDLTRSAHS